MEDAIRKSHNIILEDRKKFMLTGVTEVISFDENEIALDTVLGKVSLRGEDLKLGQFDTQKGDISGSGKIYAFVYTANESNGGFFSRLFK